MFTFAIHYLFIHLFIHSFSISSYLYSLFNSFFLASFDSTQGILRGPVDSELWYQAIRCMRTNHTSGFEKHAKCHDHRLGKLSHGFKSWTTRICSSYHANAFVKDINLSNQPLPLLWIIFWLCSFGMVRKPV